MRLGLCWMRYDVKPVCSIRYDHVMIMPSIESTELHGTGLSKPLSESILMSTEI